MPWNSFHIGKYSSALHLTAADHHPSHSTGKESMDRVSFTQPDTGHLGCFQYVSHDKKTEGWARWHLCLGHLSSCCLQVHFSRLVLKNTPYSKSGHCTASLQWQIFVVRKARAPPQGARAAEFHTHRHLLLGKFWGRGREGPSPRVHI